MHLVNQMRTDENRSASGQSDKHTNTHDELIACLTIKDKFTFILQAFLTHKQLKLFVCLACFDDYLRRSSRISFFLRNRANQANRQMGMAKNEK